MVIFVSKRMVKDRILLSSQNHVNVYLACVCVISSVISGDIKDVVIAFEVRRSTRLS